MIGRVTLGRGAWLGAGAVIRADGHDVKAGDGLHLGRGATIHIAHDVYPAILGHRVCVGEDAVVHACTLGDEVVVEEGAVVLDGAVVGAGAVVEAGSFVFPRHVLEGGMLYAGRPAKAVRPLDRHELQARADALRARNEAAPAGWHCRPVAARAAADAFVADTCDLEGDVRLAEGASLWFGCRLDARRGPIVLGRRCNVQDNSVLAAGPGGIRLGEDTTLGHNVKMAEATVGARCLVGMGSRIAPGTTVGDDSFLAGGCVTEPGQQLEGGFFWGGQPARPLGPLDDNKRAAILRTAAVYTQYAEALRGPRP
ncbi:MAG: DapH/DapD/GlmU-related protein [Rubrivivax sp.]